MRQLGPIALALVLVTCGGAPPPAASSATPRGAASPATPPASPSTSPAAAATSANGVTSTIFAVGQFHEIDAQTVAYSGTWQARINTKGESDVWVLENNRARRELWLALAPRAEPRGRQGGRPDPVPSR